MPQGLGKNLYMTLSVYENIEFFAKLLDLINNKEKKNFTTFTKYRFNKI